MSRLEELIQQYCPDGVEWKRYYDVCDLIRGITYSKNQEAKTETEDAYKVLRANNITLYLNTLNFDDVKLVSKDVVVKPEQHLYAGDILMCAGSGSKEHVGKVAYIFQNMDYTFGGFMAVVRCKEDVIPRYMFHILASHYFTSHLETQINSSTINNINRQVMQSFVFPVPPLPVQEEIVRILDTFTELQAELQKRKEQHKYYREGLLTSFVSTQNINKYKLGDICELGTGSHNTQDGLKEGAFPFYTRGVDILWLSTYDFDETAIITAGDGVGVGKVFHYVKGKYALHQRAYRIVPNQKIVLPRYLYYYFETEFYAYIMRSSVSSSVTSIRKPMLLDFPVILPSLSDQQKIVDILDSFDQLTNDLTAGLPAEIEKRRQQYEYYRDKLLTFKRKEA